MNAEPKRHKRAYEFGRNWSLNIPREAIKFLVNRLHAGMTLDEVEKHLKEKFKYSTLLPKYHESAVKYGLAVHQHNQALYQHVLTGRPSPNKRVYGGKHG